MTLEAWILLKATVLLALGLTCARLTPHARASVRHLVLATTFGALLALPIAGALAPAIAVEIPIATDTGSAARLAEPPASASGSERAVRGGDGGSMPVRRGISPSITTVVRTVWAAGAALLLATLAGSVWKLRRIRRSGIPWVAGQATVDILANESGILRPPTVLLHQHVVAPVTCGLRWPTIVLPPQARRWSEPDLRRAFVHELEHVRRGDWLVQLVARAICAAYWFHPLVWTAWRQLRLESERACDDAVMSGTEGADYAEQLVTLAERLSHPQAAPVLSMANRSDLSVRLAAVLDRTQRRGRTGTLVVAATVGAAFVFVALIAPVRAVAVSGGPAGAPPRATLDVGLVEAAERGDLASITALLNSGGDVNAAVPGDGSPLIMAAREGHAHIVRVLLDRGASIDRMVEEDENALIQASAEGHLEVVKLLVTRGADVNARAWAAASRERPDGEWRTPLSMARKHGHDGVVRYLLSVGAADQRRP